MVGSKVEYKRELLKKLNANHDLTCNESRLLTQQEDEERERIHEVEAEIALVDGEAKKCLDCGKVVWKHHSWQSFETKNGERQFYNANWTGEEGKWTPPDVVVCEKCIEEYRNSLGRKKFMEKYLGAFIVDIQVGGFGEPYSSHYRPRIESITLQKDGKRVVFKWDYDGGLKYKEAEIIEEESKDDDAEDG